MWQLLRIAALALQENSDVVLIHLGELVVGEADDLAGPDPEPRLLEGFALHTLGEVLALLEVPAGKTPVPWWMTNLLLRLNGQTG